MSTSLVQRIPSAGAVTKALTPSSSDSKLISTAASLIPGLNLTPQKSTASTPQLVSTPQQQASPAVSTPGQWQHPRMQEVIQRQNSNRFDARNLRIAGMNAGFMIVTVLLPLFASRILPLDWASAAEPYSTYLIYIIRLFFATNIVLAFSPLLRPKDNCDDIPLTPSQRQLLGLAPMTRPATPQEQQQYTTPPRYSRSTTPQSNRSSLRGNASGSPLSGTPLDSSTLQLRRSVSGSPGPSPLNYGLKPNAVGGSGRRTNFQSSPLSTPEFDAAGSVGTPTKSGKASVGLNSKWLYEKGRASPRGSPRGSFGGFGGFGGGGSVFN
ncbi:hypothetical protein LTR53_001148 [Teratosphaeriaceae sp. CCFEE 6253]|nr:hypothetical protein LTR53_001148 [Teratosphaeriaceae sp. CCFEE 6253]